MPGCDKRRLNGQMDSRVDIRHLIDNQRVIAAHFKGENFLRLTGELTMQLVASIGATGKQQAVEILQRTQRLTRFTPALHQVQHARRQASLLP